MTAPKKPLQKALKQKDTNVPRPSLREPASLTTLLSNLAVGEVYVVSSPAVHGSTLDVHQNSLADAGATITDKVVQPISRAQADTGFKFTRERNVCLTGSGRTYVQIIITRIS